MWACVCSRSLWVSPTTSPVRLGVSPAAASTPTGVLNHWFETLFLVLEPWVTRSALLPLCSSWFIYVSMWGRRVFQPPPCGVCQLQPDLPCSTIRHLAGSTSPHQPPHTALLVQVLSIPLPISTPPTGLDECLFFNSLVVGLPYSSIFCQFWLFFIFKFVLSFFWLCEEAPCVCLCLHLGRKRRNDFCEL